MGRNHLSISSLVCPLPAWNGKKLLLILCLCLSQAWNGAKKCCQSRLFVRRELGMGRNSLVNLVSSYVATLKWAETLLSISSLRLSRAPTPAWNGEKLCCQSLLLVRRELRRQLEMGKNSVVNLFSSYVASLKWAKSPVGLVSSWTKL